MLGNLRLGLGAAPSSSKTSAVALANPNSAEGRIIRTLLGGTQKRKPVEEPETPRASTSGAQNSGKSAAAAGPSTADDSEDEDSRSRAISSKGKKKADFFHDKPTKQSQSNGLVNGQSTSKKNKKRKQEEMANQAMALGSAAAADTFAKPAAPNGAQNRETSSTPASPSRMNGTSLHAEKEKADESAFDESYQDDDQSIMTETTMTGTLQGSPTPGDGEPRKKKRKNKKKKNRNAQGLDSSVLAASAPASNGLLFGESILD